MANYKAVKTGEAEIKLSKILRSIFRPIKGETNAENSNGDENVPD